jgi:choline dehydrogenase-like flavoprotein
MLLKAYYEPNKNRLNLTIITGARVVRLLTEKGSGSGIVIRGVEYLQDEALKVIEASKEVLLCAGMLSSASATFIETGVLGSYQTPQILELSGTPKFHFVRE